VLVKRVLFLLNAALAIAILHLISQVHLPSYVKMLPKYLKDSTFSSYFWSMIIFTGNGCLEILITLTKEILTIIILLMRLTAANKQLWEKNISTHRCCSQIDKCNHRISDLQYESD